MLAVLLGRRLDGEVIESGPVITLGCHNNKMHQSLAIRRPVTCIQVNSTKKSMHSEVSDSKGQN